MKTRVKFLAGCLMAAFLIPFVITLILSGVGLEKDKIGLALTAALTGNKDAKATVTMSYSVGTEEMDIDEYVTGVLPAAWKYCDNQEFLKAMAVMCRTYVKYCGAKQKRCEARFYTDTELEQLWGSAWKERKAELTLIVEQTKGQYMTCNGEVIFPYCHRLTSGYTRNFREETDYLCEAALTTDSLDENYISVKEFTAKEFYTLMKKKLPDLYMDENNPAADLQIVEKTQGGYVVLWQVGNLIIDGDTAAEILGLASPSFTCTATEGGIRFTVKGQGTGYGLSLGGAKTKAMEGASYKEILNFFYKNIVFSNLSQ